jgi:hypothetical protein
VQFTCRQASDAPIPYAAAMERNTNDERRQWYLDECLRIAVWELLFGSGRREQVEQLLAAGARWRAEPPR